MKVFIQNRHTKEYYADGGQWMATRAQALDCGCSARAAAIARQEKLGDVSIILTFQQGKETIVIPLTAQIDQRDAADQKRARS